MAFIEYNANPYGKYIDDCLIRAITKATGKDYMEVMDGLIAVADSKGWEIDEHAQERYILTQSVGTCLSLVDESQ